jgi:hypothetical protein
MPVVDADSAQQAEVTGKGNAGKRLRGALRAGSLRVRATAIRFVHDGVVGGQETAHAVRPFQIG